ncbi:hypothetical protein PHYPSEUDO_012884 [Phytophthora pseudosyringae]|uniref:Transmembrane protein n=1 Tax=Phytophthora pseudosyringae TaxID=221518 RepID=A0A8T1W4N1_9STRA|nr:hypothetical protein PHYPSEUDO_012884 [Phytophthora pseudosyringae]
MAALVLLQEVVPLQDPSKGWRANYGFWIRLAILGGAPVAGMAAFIKFMIPGVAISLRQLALISTGQAILYPMVGMAVAELWVFPIPFIVLSLIGLYVAIFAGLFRVVVGRQAIGHMATHKDELILLMSFISSQAGMAVTYAGFEVLFDAATDTNFELPVLLLLPLIKVVMKNIVSRCIVHMKDMVPEAVIFTVDFFNSMYLATCMQNSSSPTTLAAMMVIDFTQTAVSLHSLHHHTDTILSRLHHACDDAAGDGSLLPAVSSLCRDTSKFEQQCRAGIVLHSCIPHKVSGEGRKLLETLKAIPGNGIPTLPHFHTPRLREFGASFRLLEHTRAASSPSSPKSMWPCASRSVTKVKPIPDPENVARTAERSRTSGLRTGQHRKLLAETLEVLFTSECLILTEYLESVIPILYGSFILLVVHLPSAQYHIDLVGVTRDNVGETIGSVFIYALLELISFVTLAVLMLRNCRVHALYHLAFVLETQMLLVQVKLTTWVLMAFSFRVVHFGKLSRNPGQYLSFVLG